MDVHGDPRTPRDNYQAHIEEEADIKAVEMEELVQKSTQPLYKGCGVNHLQASIVLMNMINLYSVL